ncbi:MAG: type pilus assembly protein PilO [Blastocatellia bacterium]|jgi:Tfp pilus assembly protein PilO|nr:type pilus assembly protein PilO [Blastocatellia bacterium]
MKIGNIQELPWYLRLAVFSVAALLIYGGFYYLVTSGTRADTKNLQTEIDVLRGKNAEAQVAQQRLNEYRAAYKSRQEEYEELKALLPEQRELTSVLQGVTDRARGSRLVMRRFSPRDDVQQDFYSGKPIEVEVSSSFANLRSFFDQMARYQRIVSITDFKINRISEQEQGPGKTIDAQFLMTAYYVSQEKLQKSGGAPAAPGAAPATAANPAAGALAPAAGAPAK